MTFIYDTFSAYHYYLPPFIGHGYDPMHSFLTIAFLAVSIFISWITVDFVGAQNTAAGPAACMSSTLALLREESF